MPKTINSFIINRIVAGASVCDSMIVDFDCWMGSSHSEIEIENDQDANIMIIKIDGEEVDWGYIPPFHERLLRKKLTEYLNSL